jgi:hypothetical protein
MFANEEDVTGTCYGCDINNQGYNFCVNGTTQNGFITAQPDPNTYMNQVCNSNDGKCYFEWNPTCSYDQVVEKGCNTAQKCSVVKGIPTCEDVICSDATDCQTWQICDVETGEVAGKCAPVPCNTWSDCETGVCINAFNSPDGASCAACYAYQFNLSDDLNGVEFCKAYEINGTIVNPN